MQSKGDNYLPHSGNKLVSKKVSEFVITGGKFLKRDGEWNFS